MLGPNVTEFASMSQSTNPTSAPTPSITRRTAFVGAGVGAVGALAAASLLPAAVKPPVQTAQAQAKADTSGGYQLTEHVKQYYATARL